MKTAQDLLNELEQEGASQLPVFKLTLRAGSKSTIRFLPLADADYFGKIERTHNISMTWERGAIESLYCPDIYGQPCALHQIYVQCRTALEGKISPEERAWREQYVRIFQEWTDRQLTTRIIVRGAHEFEPMRFYVRAKSLVLPLSEYAEKQGVRFWDLQNGHDMTITSDGTRYALLINPKPTPYGFTIPKSDLARVLLKNEPYFAKYEETKAAAKRWVQFAKEMSEEAGGDPLSDLGDVL